MNEEQIKQAKIRAEKMDFALEKVAPRAIYTHPLYLRTWANAYGEEWGHITDFRNDTQGDQLVYPYIYIGSIMRPIKGTEYFDSISPYPYGGVHTSSYAELSHIVTKWEAHHYNNIAQDNKVVSAFIRYDPYIGNHKYDPEAVQVGEVYYVDLSKSLKKIMSGLKKSARNAITNGRKKGIKVGYGQGKEWLDRFKTIYNSAMDAKDASQRHVYHDKFYEAIDQNLTGSDVYKVFIATKDGEDIAGSLLLHGFDYGHDFARVYKDDIPVDNAHNVLLWNVIEFCHSKNLAILDLGGKDASGSYKFKESMASGTKPFFVGRKILNKEAYAELCKEKGVEPNEHGFFPAYRVTEDERKG